MESKSPNAWQRILVLNPALVRGLLVSLAAILATVLGHTVISDDLITAIIDGFVAVSALVGAVWTRGAVTPNDKVVAYKPDPLGAPHNVVVNESQSASVIQAEIDSYGGLEYEEDDLPDHVKHPQFLQDDDGTDPMYQPPYTGV